MGGPYFEDNSHIFFSQGTADRGNGGSDEYIDKVYRTPKLPPRFEKGKETVQNGRIDKKKNGKPRFYSKKPLQDEKRRIIAKQSLAAISFQANDKLFMDGLGTTQRPITAPVVVPEKLKNLASTIIQNNGRRLSSIILNHVDRDAMRIDFDKSVDSKMEKGKNAVIRNGKRSWDAEFVTSPNGHSQYSSDDISTPTSSQNWHSYDDIPSVSTPIIDESRQSDFMIENYRRLLESSTRYPSLTIEQQIQIAKYLDSRGEYAPSYMIIEKFNLQISAAHLRTLTTGCWLNDEVINFYSNLIIERAQNNPDIYPPVHIVNTFFYTKLMQSGFGYKVVGGWFIPRPNKKKKAPPPNLFDKDYIFIPVNTGAHWTLAVANFKLCRFEYYDSLGGDFNPVFLNELRAFFIYVAKQTNNQHFDFDSWSTYEPKTKTPQQKNSYDCGVFTMMTVEHMSRNAPLSFTQSKMGYFRAKMIYEISTGNIMNEVEDDDSFEEDEDESVDDDEILQSSAEHSPGAEEMQIDIVKSSTTTHQGPSVTIEII
ncbi:cysteine proteinase [Gigaspora margarita]|uniref:Cysteine proteinase n=1 Tax=Gigaspora margarita TaxID=4874 RepID=A0A8H3WX02_GIGMA|nr:cysteine proteinase [Gigaspora margarita]